MSRRKFLENCGAAVLASAPALKSWTAETHSATRIKGAAQIVLSLDRDWLFGGKTNREVKRLMLDHAFTFLDTVIFWVGEKNWRSQGAMTKIGGVKRSGLFTRELSGDTPYIIFEIGKSAYLGGGRALVE